MSQKINPDSVHLGGNSPEYYAEYVAIPKVDQPAECALPDAVPLTLTPAPLLQLNEACAYEFPGVIALPPIYNPPQVKFNACEILTANTEITTCPATKSSTLTLIAAGPIPSEEKDGAASCSLTLAGNLCVDACESFTSTSSITFPSAMSGSRMSLTPRSIPDCGVDLAADFVLNACEDFKVTNKLTYLGAARASHLDLKANGRPDCGLDLSGVIDITACETFNADVNISVSGSGRVVQKNNWVYSSSNTPNCGFSLSGDVFIHACEDFFADGQINFTGKSVKVITPIRAVPSKAPNCGLTLEGSVDITACSDFKVNGSLNITGKPVNGAITITPTGQPECGINFGGAIEIKACDEITTSGSITITSSNGRGGGTGNISLEPINDGCGLSLTGDIDITACGDVYAGGSVAVRASYPGVASGNVYLTQDGNCGVNLGGDIYVNACPTVEAVVTEFVEHTIYFDSSKQTIGSVTLRPYGVFTKSGDCNLNLKLGLAGAEGAGASFVDLSDLEGGGGTLYVEQESLTATDGCCYSAEDMPRLNYDSENNYLQLLGNIYTPTFSCDNSCGASNPFSFQTIELQSMTTGYIGSSSCCGGDSNLNLCGGAMYLSSHGAAMGASGGNVYVSQGGLIGNLSSDEVSVSGGGGFTAMYKNGFYSSYNGTLTMDPSSIHMSGSGGTAELDPAYLSLGGNGGTVQIYPVGGKGIYPVMIQVCVNGETKTMYVLGSDPF